MSTGVHRVLAADVASHFASGGTIAVSDEPAGGSPTGQPTGAVLAAGGLAKFTYDLFRDNLSESAVLGVLGALIVWAVGLLADQNTRLAPPRR